MKISYWGILHIAMYFHQPTYYITCYSRFVSPYYHAHALNEAEGLGVY